MAEVLRPDDPRLTWQGAVSLECTDGWVMPWRIPQADRALFPPDDGLPLRASMPAGVRIAFRSDTTRVAGRLADAVDRAPLDLCCDGELVATAPLAGRDAFAFEDLPPGEKLVELWLPQTGEFRLAALELSDGAAAAPFDDPRPRWVTYGSSLSHCGGATSPTRTWPAIVARGHGLNLTCLGFGGQCHLDPMIARVIRDLPADVVSMCLGINIYGAGSLSPRSYRPAIIGSVLTIRESHPDVPVVLMGTIWAGAREDTPNPVGFTLKRMRAEVADVVERLRARGDANVHYVDGREILGAEPELYTEDLCHPTAEGYETMGRRFLEKVAARLFPA